MIDIQQYAREGENLICVTFQGQLTQREYLVFSPLSVVLWHMLLDDI